MKKVLLFVFAMGLCTCVFGVMLVKDGEPFADIILHGRAYPIERFAAEELQYHVKLITGAELPIVTRPTEGKNHIYLGKVTGFPTRGMAENAALVKITPELVAIAGADGIGEALNVETAAGTLFGVYDLLEKKLGVRWLWPGETGTVVKHQKTLELAEEEWTVEPPLRAIGWRQMMNADYWDKFENADKFLNNETLWLRRMRFNSVDNYGYGHAYIKYGEL